MAKVTDRYRYSDIDFNFAKAANGDVSRKFDSNAIKQSLRNLVLSNYYERPFRPSLGANLNDILFSNFSQGATSMKAGDFNNDGWVDVFNAGASYNGVQAPFTFLIWNTTLKTFEEKNLFNDKSFSSFGGNKSTIKPYYFNDDNFIISKNNGYQIK